MISHQFIWKSFTAFHSASTIQSLLLKAYSRSKFADADKKSYDNCYPFIYYLEHGQNYYQLAASAPISIKPVLLFYGMVQLLKACLLTVDPQYPESTSVLAHGVSTRKRKKQSYEFSQDEVKVQKSGLFTHFSEKMFHVKHLDGEKYSMDQLLRRLPEMSKLYSLHYQSDHFCKIDKVTDRKITIPTTILDDYHMTLRRFEDFVLEMFPVQFTLDKDEQRTNEGPQQKMTFLLANEHTEYLTPLNCSPLLFHLYEESYYLPKSRDNLTKLPEVMIHYLLLYNLSMISRYETEWWSELLHSYSSNDYPFINQFLSISTEKVPYLLFQFLEKQLNR